MDLHYVIITLLSIAVVILLHCEDDLKTLSQSNSNDLTTVIKFLRVGVALLFVGLALVVFL